jgi:hypothetical protein
MTKLRLVASLSLLLSASASYTACSDSETSTPSAAAGAADDSRGGEAADGNPEANGGAAGQGEPGSQAGQPSEGGMSPVASDGGASTGAGGDGSDVPSLPTGPCSYSTTGGATLPPAGAQFICTAIARVYQNNGEGDYEALFGAGFYIDGSNDSSTLACDLSSATAPATGDSWKLGADHPGNCELSSQEGDTTNLWAAKSSPVSGDVTITFQNVSMTHGTTDPTDVYYLCTVKLSATLVGETGADDVDVSGTFDIKVPLGG